FTRPVTAHDRFSEPVDRCLCRGVHIDGLLVDMPCGDRILKGQADSTIDRDLFIRGPAWMATCQYLSEFGGDCCGIELHTMLMRPSLRPGSGRHKRIELT